ncbi:MAG: hypothetical protein JST58_17235 [Bacteroidetes bacterium]|nr:hypothetical protein [Bacteroidota bacterium]
MKTLKLLLTSVIVLSVSTISAKLYLQQQYLISALLTIIWVVGAASLIGKFTIKLGKAQTNFKLPNGKLPSFKLMQLQVKAFLSIISLTLIVVVSTVSAILYLNEYYTLSAVLTIVWVVSASHWINETKGKLNQSK